LDSSSFQAGGGTAPVAPADRPFAGWVRGDHLGLAIPAEPADLWSGGTAFLTEAFRASGTLATDNAVKAITRFEELAVGGTGRKLILTIAYEHAASDLPCELFVKFSRNSGDRARDRNRHHMRQEIALALASRTPGFPVRVPRCMFADFEAESGTGLLVTERVRFGQDGIEPCHVKCQDYALQDPVGHYATLVRALAGLAGSFKSGALTGDIHRYFPPDSENIFEKYRVSRPIERILERIDRIERFDAEYPSLVYHADDASAFFARVREHLASFVENAERIEQIMHRDAGYVSLCHFNANIDNAWFWTGTDGRHHCGLLDWGMVGRMHVGLALWGCLSGAEADLWDHHLDDLLGEFVRAYGACGGPTLDAGTLKHHLHLFAIFMALAALLDAPAFVRREIPGLRRDATRFDPEFDVHENARVQLHILNTFLRIWDRLDFDRLHDEIADTA